ncbi:carbonic anhydrase [Skermanella stibiiresistens SB22]|uniref:carbonic anhydrase n=1 Tax=Skermanella stibiiresistens SB22 TaxID=1385369 RepID=W9HB89_9PROT|nr:carbonic anhydrase [Skermanella stibiiresistens]EWY41982.1 carbonic anhydrase [Skermanella stibiiresistens SB22]
MTSPLGTGISRFQKGFYRRHRHAYRTLASEGQKPETLFIACADSRVIPSAITSAKPGDLFELRNVGNMVPAYGSNCDSTGSAIEYSLHVLGVKRIIVCGHSKCGACNALLTGKAPDELTQTVSWIEQGRGVRELLLSSLEGEEFDLETALLDDAHKHQLEGAFERAMVVHQLKNLMTYPEVARRVEDGSLEIHGWHYGIENGVVEEFDSENLVFKPVKADDPPKLLGRTLQSFTSLSW